MSKLSDEQIDAIKDDLLVIMRERFHKSEQIAATVEATGGYDYETDSLGLMRAEDQAGEAYTALKMWSEVVLSVLKAK